jgi:hypothetical protein
MSRVSAPVSKAVPNFGPNESLFDGPVLSQPTPLRKFPGGQKTMPLPGVPRLPVNPFPEIARRRLHWSLY